MENAGRSLFLFSSLITTSTHCDCAEMLFCPARPGAAVVSAWRLAGDERRADKMRKNGRTKITLHFQSRAAPGRRSLISFAFSQIGRRLL